MTAAYPGDVVTRGVGSRIASRTVGVSQKDAAKAGETARQRDVFTATNRVEPVALTVKKIGAGAGQRELQAVEGQVQFVDEASRGRRGQTSGEVVIVM